MGSSCDENCDKVPNYDKKLRIHNTDSSTESSMNRFDAFLFAKLDMSEHGDRHARHLDLARLHDSEQHLDKASPRQEVLGVLFFPIEKTVF